MDERMKLKIQRYPELPAIAATSSKDSLEAHLLSLKKSWSHLRFTFGLKQPMLEE